VGENGSSPVSDESWIPVGVNGTVANYEETKFANFVLQVIAEHNVSDKAHPLFVNYDIHIAHEPIQVPREYFDRQQRLTNATLSQTGLGDYDHRRTTYQAMVLFMDGVIGNITQALRAKGMYEDSLIMFTSDNGGPSFDDSHHLAANNYPLRGIVLHIAFERIERTWRPANLFVHFLFGVLSVCLLAGSKNSDYEGGIRAVGFLSGGFIASVAPQMTGTKLGGIVHIADWYERRETRGGTKEADVAICDI
jgi:arylsulfatase I/J